MSFIHELQALSNPKDPWVENTVSDILATIGVKCRERAQAHSRSLSGYYKEPYDVSWGKIIPDRKPLQEGRTYRWAKGDSAADLARKWMPPQCTEYYDRSLNDANLVKTKVEQGIRELGFTNYSVKVVPCEEFTVTEKLGWISDRVVTAKKTGKTGFCFYISVQW